MKNLNFGQKTPMLKVSGIKKVQYYCPNETIHPLETLTSVMHFWEAKGIHLN